MPGLGIVPYGARQSGGLSRVLWCLRFYEALEDHLLSGSAQLPAWLPPCSRRVHVATFRAFFRALTMTSPKLETHPGHAFGRCAESGQWCSGIGPPGIFLMQSWQPNGTFDLSRTFCTLRTASHSAPFFWQRLSELNWKGQLTGFAACPNLFSHVMPWACAVASFQAQELIPDYCPAWPGNEAWNI